MINIDITCSPSKLLNYNENQIKTIIKTVIKNEGVSKADISIVFSDDNLINKLKKDFFKIDEYSDVVAFRLNDYINRNIEGEIYISVQRVFENAKNYNEKRSKEISRVLIHGVLHLLNYKDKSKKEKIFMTKKENQYLNMVNWKFLYD